MKNRHPIDDLFKDALGNYSVEAPEHVWEKIESKRTAFYIFANNFKQNYRTWLSVCGGLLFLISAFAYLFQGPDAGQGLAQAKADSSNNSFIEASSRANNGSNNTADAQISKSTSAGEENITALPKEEVIQPSTATSKKSPERNISATADDSEDVQLEENETATDNNYTEEQISPMGSGLLGNLKPANSNNIPAAGQKGSTNTIGSSDNVLAALSGNIPLNNTVKAPESIVGKTLAPATDYHSAKVEVKKAEEPVKEEVPVEVKKPAEKAEVNKTAEKPDYLKNKWSIELLSSVDYVTKNINADGLPNAQEYITGRKDAEKITSAYGFQFRVNYNLNNKDQLKKPLLITTGLNYSRINESLKFNRPYTYDKIEERTYTGVIVDPITGPRPVTYTVQDTIQVTDFEEVKSKNSYTFIDLPVLLQYTVIDKNKWSLSARGGVLLNLLLMTEGELIEKNVSELVNMSSASSPFKARAGADLYFNIGYAHKCRKNLEFLAEPAVRIGTGSLFDKGYGVKQSFTTYNLNLGFRYKF